MAGFDVVGVDIMPQPRYPYKFIQADALTFDLSAFDAIHASPPCQRFSAGTRALDAERYPDLVSPTKARLVRSGKPWVIENVSGVLMDRYQRAISLCGCMFDLRAEDTDGETVYLKRKRVFMTNFELEVPRRCDHSGITRVGGAYSMGSRDISAYRRGYVPSKAVLQKLMQIDWMTEKEMYQAIPPKYTEYVGKRLHFLLEQQKLAQVD